jgi:hydrogenase expression/formation protein HypD
MVSSEGACAAYYHFGRLHRQMATEVGAGAPVPV